MLIFLFFFIFIVFALSFNYKSTQPKKLDKNAIIRQKVEQKKQENLPWETKFSRLISYRNKAKDLEKVNLHESINLYYQAFNYGKASLSYVNYAHDIERLIILLTKTKQKKHLITFLEQLIEMYPQSKDVSKWRVRLSKLRPTITIDKSKLNPESIKGYTPPGETIGEKVKTFQAKLPEFNFYYDMPNGMETFTYIRLNNLVSFEQNTGYRMLRQAFKSILDQARVEENSQNDKKAIEIYLKLIGEGYDGKEPFERLMIIFRKLKWKVQEVAIIEKGIAYFANRRERDKASVLILAEKYGKTDFAIDYIDKNKRIQYYGGLFDLYNPFLFIEKWKARLEKLKD